MNKEMLTSIWAVSVSLCTVPYKILFLKGTCAGSQLAAISRLRR